MSKHQEALNYMVHCGKCTLRIQCKECKRNYECSFYLASKKLQELVDKATPKKVLNTELHHIDAILKRTKCPQCSNYTYGFRYSVIKFCRHCGQALDWSNEDE